MKNNNIKLLIIILFSIGICEINFTGNISNLNSLPISAYDISHAGAVSNSSNPFSVFKNPILKQTGSNEISYNYNSYFSGEFNSSLFLFPQKQFKKWQTKLGLILISIPNIPDTRQLFDGIANVPKYNSITKFSFNQYALLINFSKDVNEKRYYGINVIPHFYKLSNQTAYGLIFNGGGLIDLGANIKYSFIINSILGSFTVWGNNEIELYPLELKNCLTYRFRKIQLFSNLNYSSKHASVFNSNFWVKDGIELSFGVEYNINKYLQLIIAHGNENKIGAGFLFKFQGVNIYYGAGKQNLDSFDLFHHGIDFSFDLNKVDKWQNLLEP